MRIKEIEVDLSKIAGTIERTKPEAINAKYKIDQELFIARSFIKDGSIAYFKTKAKVKSSMYSPTFKDNIYIISAISSNGEFETHITEKDLESMVAEGALYENNN